MRNTGLLLFQLDTKKLLNFIVIRTKSRHLIPLRPIRVRSVIVIVLYLLATYPYAPLLCFFYFFKEKAISGDNELPLQ